VGDLLGAEVAQRLLTNTRQGDVVARMGGDEFALLQHGVHNPALALALTLAERAGAVVGQTIEAKGQPVQIGLSVGIAVFPDHGQSPDALVHRADAALYAAKAAGRGQAAIWQGEQQGS
jgi:diguanylate cyclase (GGDEF)-like protein